jgi:hypothetical protein
MATRTPQDRIANDYVIPVVHVRVPQRFGDAAFWVGVAGVVAAGAVELPVAALVAAGVVVMRHRSIAR